jgi:hypothetical protein
MEIHAGAPACPNQAGGGVMEFEFIISAECGTPLQIGIVEASSLAVAIAEIAEVHEFDADAVRITVEELVQPVLERPMHVCGGQR